MNPAGPGAAQLSVQVFLEPVGSNSRIRRGPMLRAATSSLVSPREWTAAAVSEFAQVPDAGRSPVFLSGPGDVARPFEVLGKIDDDAIIAIVELIRSSPAAPQPPTSVPRGSASDVLLRVQGRWPVLRLIVHSADDVEVLAVEPSPPEGQGQVVRLQRRERTWTVVSVGLWIV